MIVVQEADLPHASTILLATYATVGLSVVCHGVTAAPLARRYASWYGSHPSDALPAMESIPAGAHRWRRPSRAAEVAATDRPEGPPTLVEAPSAVSTRPSAPAA